MSNMKDIRFKKITLNGFRGQTREILFADGHTQIVGANGTGKTCVYVAVKWCLTGVDERNRTNYNLFDDALEFSPETAHPVSAELSVEADGIEYIFKRQAIQKWIRKRGSAEYTKAPSDEYKFYVDELELSATAYKDKVAEVFCMDVEKLKLCMDVLYYQLLDWKELRKHFADIVGEIKEEDMIGDYSSIMPYLAKYKGSEKAKEYLRQQINPLKLQVKVIDADIKATERQLPDLTPVLDAENLIIEKKSRIAEVNKKILGLESVNKPYIEKRNAELAEIERVQQEYDDKVHECTVKHRKKIAEIQEELDIANRHNASIDEQMKKHEQLMANHKACIKLCQENIDDIENELTRLRAQNKELKSRVFSEAVCPQCGQSLPVEMLAELHAKFYEDIDKLRKPIVERGKRLSVMLETQKVKLEKLKSEEIIFTDSSATRIDTSEICERLKLAQQNTSTSADTEAIRALAEKIENMRVKLTVIPEVDAVELQTEIEVLVSEIETLSKIASRRESYEKCEKDIVQLQKDKREVGIKLAEWEGLCEKLMAREREWADMVRDRANRYLEYSHVEMVDISKSGELIDTCTLTINGIDRGVTNHANKTLIGIDISNAICKRYGVLLPLFIDDFEHFTAELTHTGDRQVVTLSADKHFDTLTIL